MRMNARDLLAALAATAMFVAAPAYAEITRIAGPTHVLSESRLFVKFDTAFDPVNQVYLTVWGTQHNGPANGQFISLGGTPIGSPFRISDGAQQSGWARVIYAEQGRFLVSYTKILGTSLHQRVARFVRYASGSGSLGSEIVIDTWNGGAGGEPGMAYSRGRLLVTWWNFNDQFPQSYVAVLDQNGGILVPKKTVSRAGDGQTEPEIACDSSRGRCLVVGQAWGVYSPDGRTPGTWAQFIADDTGDPVGGPFFVDFAPVEKEPSVAYSAAGGKFIVTFSVSQNTVRAATIDAATLAPGTPYTLRYPGQDPDDGGGYGRPRIVYNPATRTNLVAIKPWIARTGALELDANGSIIPDTWQMTPVAGHWSQGTQEVSPAADHLHSRFLITDNQNFVNMRATVYGAAAAGVAPPPQPQTCSVSFSPTGYSFGTAGGPASFAVTTSPAGCAWTVSSGASWISVNGSSSRNGSDSVSYTVAANGGLARTGTINVAGQNHTVTQGGYQPTARRLDFNEDGHTDIVWQNQATGELALWRMNGLSVAASTPLQPGRVSDTGWKVVGSSDFNGDGYSDLVWQHDGGYVAVWLMRGDTMMRGELITSRPISDTAWRIVASGDLNGDSWPDLLWQHTSGAISVWYMRGLQMLSGELIGNNRNPLWRVAGADDFNGDGRLDLVLRNSAEGENLFWLLNDRTILASQGLGPTVPNLDWEIVGTGDHNADARPDLLWRNRRSGELVVWLMNGTTLLRSAPLNPQAVPNVDWVIVGPR